MFPELVPAGYEGNMEITYVIKPMLPIVNPDEQLTVGTALQSFMS